MTACVASESSAGISAFAKVFRMVLQSAILGLGAYYVIQGADVGRPDDRRLDPDVPRARSHRDRGRALEGLHRLPPGLSPPRAHHVHRAGPGPAHAAAGPQGRPVGRRRLYRRPRRFAAHRPGRHAPAPGGPGPRPHRPQRLGQVDPRPRPRRRVADPARRDPPRWGRPRPVGAGSARPPYRLPAPGRGAVRRHHCREHLALPAGRQAGGRHRGSADRRRP